jgi:hypothetical protein
VRDPPRRAADVNDGTYQEEAPGSAHTGLEAEAALAVVLDASALALHFAISMTDQRKPVNPRGNVANLQATWSA